MIYSNKLLKDKFKSFLVQEVAKVEARPVLNVIQIGDNFASSKYVARKQLYGQEIGLEVIVHQLPMDQGPKHIQSILDRANLGNSGLIFQLPVEAQFETFVRQTPLISDVDLLGEDSYKLLVRGFLTPTIGAIDLVLKDILAKDLELDFETSLNLRGQVVAVIGQGKLVGEPLLQYLVSRHATVLSLNSSTPNTKDLLSKANIVITAAGKPNFIQADWFKPQTIVIDAATAESNGALVGDVHKENWPDNLTLCPSPGGVGPLTVAYIFYNLLKLQTEF